MNVSFNFILHLLFLRFSCGTLAVEEPHGNLRPARFMGGVKWNVFGDNEVSEGTFSHYTIMLNGLLGGGHTATVDVIYSVLEDHHVITQSFSKAVQRGVLEYSGAGRISYNGSKLTFLAEKDGQAFGGLKIGIHIHYSEMIAPTQDIRVQLTNPGSTTGALVGIERKEVTTTIRQAKSRTCVDDPNGLVAKAGFKCNEIVNLGCLKYLSQFDTENLIPPDVRIQDPIICPASCNNCDSLNQHEHIHYESARNYCNRKMLKRSTQCLPGLNFLGVGFDARRAGNDDVAYRSTEPVMAFRTSEWEKNDNILPETKNFIVPSPDEGTWDPRIKDQEKKDVQKWNNAKQVSANLAARFGIKSSTGVGKSGSMSYQHGSSEQSMTAIGTHTFILGTFRLNPAQCNLTKGFKNSVMNLPKNFLPRNHANLRRWREFFGLYGTHYVHSFSVGGRIRVTKKINSCSDMSSVAADISAQLNGKDKKPKGSVKGGKSKSSNTLANAQSTQFDFVGGGVQASKIFREKGWQYFKTLVLLDPDLVDLKVHSILSLFEHMGYADKEREFQKAMAFYMKTVQSGAKKPHIPTPDCSEKPGHTRMMIAGVFFGTVVLLILFKVILDYRRGECDGCMKMSQLRCESCIKRHHNSQSDEKPQEQKEDNNKV